MYNNHQKKILFIRNDKIGDLLVTLPAIKAVKDRYPYYKISLLVSKYTSSLLFNIDYIDEIIIEENKYKGYIGLLRLVKCIRRKRYDVGIVLYPCWRNAWLSFLAAIPVRIGTGYKLCGVLFNKRIYLHRTKNKLIHETEYCAKHLEYFKITQVDEKIELKIREEDKNYIFELLKKFKLKRDTNLVVIHPGNGKSALNWPIENFIKLINLIEKNNKIKIILTGAEADKEFIDNIKDKVNNNLKVINLFNQTNIHQLKALLSLGNFFIGTSTGPMHLAAAVNAKVIALFPPLLSQRPEKWSPLGKNHTIILPPKVNCLQKRCKLKRCKYYHCMDKITPEMVYNTLLERINNEDY